MKKSSAISSVTNRLIPVVVVLGHVDHGKTTLLDVIRKTKVAEKEHGGITQSIGAYQVSIDTSDLKGEKKDKRKITFIDTPGHEAFIQMRGRGAKVADIAILVVAANDGVMPQTEESLKFIKEANIPFIVVLNKIDLPNINIDKIKKQLTKAGVKLEDYGGETPLVPISAKTGKGIDKLLEMILLLSDLYQNRQKTSPNFQGVVIESCLSAGKGPTASIIVRAGSLSQGDKIICQGQEFRVRAIFDWKAKRLNKVHAGDPAEVIGWKKLPDAGTILYNKQQAEVGSLPKKDIGQVESKVLDTNKIPPREQLKLKLIIKADTAGSLEAIIDGLTDKIQIISSGVGSITESDILLAKTTKSIVIGFNIKPKETVEKLAFSEKVVIKTYNLIYELFEEIEEAAELLLKGPEKNILGEAKILALFPRKKEVIVGVKVISGKISKGNKVKVIRGSEEIGKAKVVSLQHHKIPVNKVNQGSEAGMLLSKKLDFLTGDTIISIG